MPLALESDALTELELQPSFRLAPAGDSSTGSPEHYVRMLSCHPYSFVLAQNEFIFNPDVAIFFPSMDVSEEQVLQPKPPCLFCLMAWRLRGGSSNLRVCSEKVIDTQPTATLPPLVVFWAERAGVLWQYISRAAV